MAWEKRGDGLYYYRKRRDGEIVVSEYVGAGDLGELAATLDALDRQEREQERQRSHEWREQIDAISRTGSEAEAAIRELTAAWLIVHGYHCHKGQWRRRRKRDKDN